ncbi:hypothetical protein [Listeria aquatica]|uniref:hypothetical protein n=1 Tax=Listeria aquatica TaxID=1494960 RepID=UPI0031F5CA3B
MSFSNMIVGENGLLAELRFYNTFNERTFAEIINYVGEHLTEWRSNSFIPVSDAVSIFNLINELSGGNRFWNEEVTRRVEDAVLELQEIINSLEE